MNYNKAILVGTITTDISLSVPTNGKSMIVFGMATANKFTTADGEKKSEPIFHRIVAWGQVADLMKSMCSKGDEVLIDGKIVNKKYKKKDGSTGFSSEIYVEKYQVRSKNKKAEQLELGEELSTTGDSPDIKDDFDFNDIQL